MAAKTRSAARLLTPDEAAGLLRVHVETVRTWLREGHLAGTKTPGGGEWRIHPATIQRFWDEASGP